MNFITFFELFFNCSLLWIFLQVIWYNLISAIYEFSVPWILWGTLVIFIGLRLIRVKPPDSTIIDEVIGVNPLTLDKNNSTTENKGNGEKFCMRVVAHRGGGFDYPENSLSAFRNSKSKGCHAIECDVALTKDNIPIMFHDDTIERLTGKIGTIREMTWEQLKELDISETHLLKSKFEDGEKILQLHEAVEECLKNEQRIILDIKETCTEMVQIILDTFKKYPKLYERAVVSSFYPTVIYMIRRKEPRIIGSLAWRPDYFSRESYLSLDGPGPVRYSNPFKHVLACLLDTFYEWALPRFVYYILGISTILLHKDTVNQRVVKEWYDRNVRVMAWTVNRPSEKLHFSNLLKVTYLTDTLLAEKTEAKQ
ncbi:glycerophosphodiester phosphodiesterase 1 [Prorops nasuta]|uniref:glycerophosphodiester phosphodiesterase 1 n=1 Tax=Prorops nasuta TaxID=863751 RepID=UPI0034CD9234